MQSTQIILINRIIQRIKNRYNPHYDIAPGSPMVTWVENELLETIERLVIEVEYLQEQIYGLKQQ